MNNIQYTDQQLQLALAKMLPTKIRIYKHCFKWGFGVHTVGDTIKETEWLHVCWMIEQTLKNQEEYRDYLIYITTYSLPHDTEYEQTRNSLSASWQQRAIALAKVKGIEIL